MNCNGNFWANAGVIGVLVLAAIAAFALAVTWDKRERIPECFPDGTPLTSRERDALTALETQLAEQPRIIRGPS
jgi:hypothetical protein